MKRIIKLLICTLFPISLYATETLGHLFDPDPRISGKYRNKSIRYGIPANSCSMDITETLGKRFIICTPFVGIRENTVQISLRAKIAMPEKKMREIVRRHLAGADIQEILLAVDYVQGLAVYGEVQDIVLAPPKVITKSKYQSKPAMPKMCIAEGKVWNTSGASAPRQEYKYLGCTLIEENLYDCSREVRISSGSTVGVGICEEAMEAVLKCDILDIHERATCMGKLSSNRNHERDANRLQIGQKGIVVSEVDCAPLMQTTSAYSSSIKCYPPGAELMVIEVTDVDSDFTFPNGNYVKGRMYKVSIDNNTGYMFGKFIKQ